MSNATRDFDSALVTEFEGDFFRFAIFADLELDSGTVYVHNGVGNYTFGGNEYIGLGDLGVIEPIEEGTEISSYPIKVTLSAIEAALKESDVDFYSSVIAESYYGRNLTIRIGAFDANYDLVADPQIIWSGQMQAPDLQVGRQNLISVSAESELAIFDKSNGRLFSDSDLQDEFSGDLGFEYLEQLEEEKVVWRQSLVIVGSGTSGTGGGPDETKRVVDDADTQAY